MNEKLRVFSIPEHIKPIFERIKTFMQRNWDNIDIPPAYHPFLPSASSLAIRMYYEAKQQKDASKTEELN